VESLQVGGGAGAKKKAAKKGAQEATGSRAPPPPPPPPPAPVEPHGIKLNGNPAQPLQQPIFPKPPPPPPSLASQPSPVASGGDRRLSHVIIPVSTEAANLSYLGGMEQPGVGHIYLRNHAGGPSPTSDSLRTRSDPPMPARSPYAPVGGESVLHPGAAPGPAPLRASSSPPPRFCAQCGSSLISNARFCSQCGVPVAAPVAAPHPLPVSVPTPTHPVPEVAIAYAAPAHAAPPATSTAGWEPTNGTVSQTSPLLFRELSADVIGGGGEEAESFGKSLVSGDCDRGGLVLTGCDCYAAEYMPFNKPNPESANQPQKSLPFFQSLRSEPKRTDPRVGHPGSRMSGYLS
jgi:hypothetical protein